MIGNAPDPCSPFLLVLSVSKPVGKERMPQPLSCAWTLEVTWPAWSFNMFVQLGWGKLALVDLLRCKLNLKVLCFHLGIGVSISKTRMVINIISTMDWGTPNEVIPWNHDRWCFAPHFGHPILGNPNVEALAMQLMSTAPQPGGI